MERERRKKKERAFTPFLPPPLPARYIDAPNKQNQKCFVCVRRKQSVALSTATSVRKKQR